MEDTIIGEWLKSLHLDEHTESFLDNGYDDLEICKQISAPDLDAIGVIDANQRTALLDAVQRLREEGAASVYFTVEEAQAVREPPDTFKRRWQQREVNSCGVTGSSSAASTPADSGINKHFLVDAAAGSDGSSAGSVDAYEAGRAELVKLPHTQLRNLLTLLLHKEGITLTLEPYTAQDGSRGVLEGLASRYADQVNTHYQDVLEHLDSLRTEALSSAAKPPDDDGGTINDSSGPTPVAEGSTTTTTVSTDALGSSAKVSASVSTGQLSSVSSSSPEPSTLASVSRCYLQHYASTDQAIYVPGKYNPSSCLSDAEEDEIYGYTVDGTRGGGGRREGLSGEPQRASTAQGLLNPRSQLIYELPPVGGRVGGKRRLGIGRLIKTLRRDFRRAAPSKLKSAPSSGRFGDGSARGSSLTCGRMVCGSSAAMMTTSTDDQQLISCPQPHPTTATTPLMVLPGYYYYQQQQPNSTTTTTNNHHQQQSSSSSSTTTTSATTQQQQLPPPQHHHYQHYHQHSNTTNTTTLTESNASSSPRGSEHSSSEQSSSGAAQMLLQHQWQSSGGVLAAPRTSPITSSSPAPPPKDSGLQQAIERLKEQEALRRRHDQFVEHEQMLRDLRQGLLRGGSDPLHPSQRGAAVFYDNSTVAPPQHHTSEKEEVRDGRRRRVGGRREDHGALHHDLVHPQHWYDEPPYESDPEDFLLDALSQEDLHTRSLRDSLREEDVISLRTAGDISLPRTGSDTIPLLQGSLSSIAADSAGRLAAPAPAPQPFYATIDSNCKQYLESSHHWLPQQNHHHIHTLGALKGRPDVASSSSHYGTTTQGHHHHKAMSSMDRPHHHAAASSSYYYYNYFQREGGFVVYGGGGRQGQQQQLREYGPTHPHQAAPPHPSLNSREEVSWEGRVGGAWSSEPQYREPYCLRGGGASGGGGRSKREAGGKENKNKKDKRMMDGGDLSTAARRDGKRNSNVEQSSSGEYQVPFGSSSLLQYNGPVYDNISNTAPFGGGVGGSVRVNHSSSKASSRSNNTLIGTSKHHHNMAPSSAGGGGTTRHNLHLRGLTTSQQVYLQQQQDGLEEEEVSSSGPTSPDYHLRWDLHSITTIGAPARVLRRGGGSQSTTDDRGGRYHHHQYLLEQQHRSTSAAAPTALEDTSAVMVSGVPAARLANNNLIPAATAASDRMACRRPAAAAPPCSCCSSSSSLVVPKTNSSCSSVVVSPGVNLLVSAGDKLPTASGVCTSVLDGKSCCSDGNASIGAITQFMPGETISSVVGPNIHGSSFSSCLCCKNELYVPQKSTVGDNADVANVSRCSTGFLLNEHSSSSLSPAVPVRHTLSSSSSVSSDSAVNSSLAPCCVSLPQNSRNMPFPSSSATRHNLLLSCCSHLPPGPPHLFPPSSPHHSLSSHHQKSSSSKLVLHHPHQSYSHYPNNVAHSQNLLPNTLELIPPCCCGPSSVVGPTSLAGPTSILPPQLISSSKVEKVQANNLSIVTTSSSNPHLVSSSSQLLFAVPASITQPASQSPRDVTRISSTPGVLNVSPLVDSIGKVAVDMDVGSNSKLKLPNSKENENNINRINKQNNNISSDSFDENISEHIKNNLNICSNLKTSAKNYSDKIYRTAQPPLVPPRKKIGTLATGGGVDGSPATSVAPGSVATTTIPVVSSTTVVSLSLALQKTPAHVV